MDDEPSRWWRRFLSHSIVPRGRRGKHCWTGTARGMGKGDDTARPVRRGGSKVGTVHTYASQRRAPPELKYLFKRGKDTAGGETRDARAERLRRERDEARARRRAEAEARPRRPLREQWSNRRCYKSPA